MYIWELEYNGQQWDDFLLVFFCLLIWFNSETTLY